MFSMKIKKLTKARCRLEEFNSCPGKEHLLGVLRECSIRFRFVNVLCERKYQTWRNDGSTAVLIVSKESPFAALMELAEAVGAMRADEVSYTLTAKGNAVLRLWWD